MFEVANFSTVYDLLYGIMKALSVTLNEIYGIIDLDVEMKGQYSGQRSNLRSPT